MPVDFSKQKGQKRLKLTKNAKLGEELMITFNESELREKRIQFEKEESEKAGEDSALIGTS